MEETAGKAESSGPIGVLLDVLGEYIEYANGRSEPGVSVSLLQDWLDDARYEHNQEWRQRQAADGA